MNIKVETTEESWETYRWRGIVELIDFNLGLGLFLWGFNHDFFGIVVRTGDDGFRTWARSSCPRRSSHSFGTGRSFRLKERRLADK
jgi:hypothetical protein